MNKDKSDPLVKGIVLLIFAGMILFLMKCGPGPADIHITTPSEIQKQDSINRVDSTAKAIKADSAQIIHIDTFPKP